MIIWFFTGNLTCYNLAYLLLRQIKFIFSLFIPIWLSPWRSLSWISFPPSKKAVSFLHPAHLSRESGNKCCLLWIKSSIIVCRLDWLARLLTPLFVFDVKWLLYAFKSHDYEHGKMTWMRKWRERCFNATKNVCLRWLFVKIILLWTHDGLNSAEEKRGVLWYFKFWRTGTWFCMSSGLVSVRNIFNQIEIRRSSSK